MATDCTWSEQKLPFGVIPSANCNGVAWANIPGRGVQEMPPAQLEEQKQDQMRDLFTILRNPKALKARVVPGGLSLPGADETRYPAVAVESDVIQDWRILFDPNGGRIAAIQYVGQPPTGGPPATMTETFGDYRTVGGVVSLPHQHGVLVNGDTFIDMKTTEATVNTAPPASLFEKPKP
jgi:hypothetical protein